MRSSSQFDPQNQATQPKTPMTIVLTANQSSSIPQSPCMALGRGGSCRRAAASLLCVQFSEDQVCWIWSATSWAEAPPT